MVCALAVAQRLLKVFAASRTFPLAGERSFIRLPCHVPGLLRIVPGVAGVESDSSNWAIGIRGSVIWTL
jgi:hypothetical protein